MLMKALRIGWMGAAGLAFLLVAMTSGADKPEPAAKAYIDGTGPDWKALGEDDFVAVNGEKDTWAWKDGAVHCTGKPVGVARTKKQYTNFEIVLEWNHRKRSGNSGVFVWCPEEALKGLKPGQLPRGGIELQVLDHGYAEDFEKSKKKKPDWFTTNGDVFPVGSSKMKPFAPTAPKGMRAFPRKNTTRGFGQWNHYYARAINGEIRLWVNGEEVTGGNECTPKSGYVCLEAEGSPIDFKNIRIRELP
jgi:hypothetical protein